MNLLFVVRLGRVIQSIYVCTEICTNSFFQIPYSNIFQYINFCRKKCSVSGSAFFFTNKVYVLYHVMPVGALDLALVGCALDAQDLVEVPTLLSLLRHRGVLFTSHC